MVREVELLLSGVYKRSAADLSGAGERVLAQASPRAPVSMAWLGRFDDFNSVSARPGVSDKVNLPSKRVPRASNSSPASKPPSSEPGPAGYCKIRDISSKMNTVVS